MKKKNRPTCGHGSASKVRDGTGQWLQSA